MRHRVHVPLVLLLSVLAADVALAAPWRQLVAPADVGWDEEALDAAHALAESIGSAAVMVVEDGAVVVAWGDVTRPFKCHSVRKSVLSLLIGLEVDRGTIDLDATVGALGVHELQSLTPTERRARVRDLMASRSGVYLPAAKEPRSMKDARPARGSSEPGARFWYNNWDFNTLGAIYERVTGRDICAGLRDELAVPLGLEDADDASCDFELEPSRTPIPAYAMRLSTRDLARIGRLVASEGRWQGESIVSEAWIRASTRPVTTFEDGSGFGLMWWCHPAGTMPASPHATKHEIVSARGTGGQVIVVVPEQDLVIVHRGDTDNGRHVKGGDVWRLVEAILAARSPSAPSSPEGRRLGPLRPRPLAGVLPPPTPRPRIAVSPVALEAFVGRYRMGPELVATVHVHDGRLFVRTSDDQEGELIAEAPDRFFHRTVDVQIAFERDAEGRVHAARVTIGGRTMPPAPRIDDGSRDRR